METILDDFVEEEVEPTMADLIEEEYSENEIVKELKGMEREYGTNSYFQAIRKYRVLTFDEVAQLSNDFKTKGDEKARELLILHNLRLVVFLAHKFMGRGLDFEDLIQEET